MTEVDFELVVPPQPAERVREVIRLADEVFGGIDGPDLEWRLARLPEPSLALARDTSGLLGFKIGYALSMRRYYSWLGGVAARGRRHGIARGLMALQHDWVSSRGFSSIETAATTDNAAMLELDRTFGFEAIGSYERDGLARVTLYKSLREG